MRKPTSIALAVITLSHLSLSAQDSTIATLKVQYEANQIKELSSDKPQSHTDNFVLQIGSGVSYYYDPQTYYIDSLINDPSGKALRDKIFEDALAEFMRNGTDAFKIMKEKGMLAKNRYSCLKDFNKNAITVWDRSGSDRYRYDVDMTDLNWELYDSTKTIMGYECHMATTYYHGRKWIAWFAPEISVSEGPWQLCGLPGLIIEATTDDSAYSFIITGLQKCNEPFKNTFEDDNLFKTSRKSFLKMKDHTRRNRSSQINAMTGGQVVAKNADYTGTDDFLETDYH